MRPVLKITDLEDYVQLSTQLGNTIGILCKMYNVVVTVVQFWKKKQIKILQEVLCLGYICRQNPCFFCPFSVNTAQGQLSGNYLLTARKYHLVRNPLSSRILSQNVNIKVLETIILPVVLYGRETQSLTLREEHILRMFQNRVLRRIYGPQRDEIKQQRGS
jgi:hypothetical protein